MNNPSIGQKITAFDGSDAWVQWNVNQNASMSQRVHRSQLFTPQEVFEAAEDLIPPTTAGNEISLERGVKEVLDNHVQSEEVALRLGLLALEKYVTKPRTPEELGVKTKEELLGATDERGTNLWRVQDLVNGIQRGLYKEEDGTRNELTVARPSRDLEILPEAEAAPVRQAIDDVNRTVLDTIYDQYGADFEHAEVMERVKQGYIERRTVVPAPGARISFVETAYTPVGAPVMNPSITAVTVQAGHPDFSLESGYIRSV